MVETGTSLEYSPLMSCDKCLAMSVASMNRKSVCPESRCYKYIQTQLCTLCVLRPSRDGWFASCFVTDTCSVDSQLISVMQRRICGRTYLNSCHPQAVTLCAHQRSLCVDPLIAPLPPSFTNGRDPW